MTIAPVKVRGTQSFVHTLGWCWRHPSLLGLELVWRWTFGIPALWVMFHYGSGILSANQEALRETGVFQVSLQNPTLTAETVGQAALVLLGPVWAVARWLAPVLAVGWAVASALGRTLVLRRYDRRIAARPFTLTVLQLLRVGALAGSFWAWWRCLQWAAASSLAGPGEPNLVGYFAKAIYLSLGVFAAWALVGWVFAAAPLVAVLEDRGVFGSLARSVRLGPLGSKLMEINLVLGIVKLALIVLAIVFSSTPLPFQSVMTDAALREWWVVVTIWYLAASDFFQVARVVATVELWRGERGGLQSDL